MDENDGLIVRNTSENNEGFQITLGAEKNYQLSSGGIFLVGADILYFQNVRRTNHRYSNRSLDNPQQAQPSDIFNSYSRVTVSHNLALNINAGFKFNITDRILLIPRVTYTSVLNNMNNRVSEEFGEPLFGENLSSNHDVFMTGNLNYGVALGWSF